MKPHVLILAHYDEIEPRSVTQYESWDAAYEGQKAWQEQAHREQRDCLGLYLCIVPLQSPEDQPSAIEQVKALPQLPQAQYSLQQQLSELYSAAVKLGLYDAADAVRRIA